MAWYAQDDLRYVHVWDKWLVWDGHRWDVVPTHPVAGEWNEPPAEGIVIRGAPISDEAWQLVDREMWEAKWR